MRLLLDESLPHLLTRSFAGHEVGTVQTAGWAGIGNGELLRLAANSNYDAFITPDKGFEYQQNLAQLPLTVAILRAGSNRLEDLETLIPELLRELERADPCSLIKLGI